MKPKAIGLTTTVSTLDMTQYWSRLIKSIDKDITILAGGPEATINPRNVLQSCESVDYIFRGESENIWSKICDYI